VVGFLLGFEGEVGLVCERKWRFVVGVGVARKKKKKLTSSTSASQSKIPLWFMVMRASLGVSPLACVKERRMLTTCFGVWGV
jgi:hypothetical protein